MKKIIEAVKKGWEDFTTLARNPNFYFTFPLLGFLLLVAFNWTALAGLFAVVQAIVILLNINED